jgi:L-threo-3-deoxy-hexylosonate aldolase
MTERKLAISTTRSVLDKNGYSHIPIVAGTGMMSLKETLEMTRQAKEAGAAFSLVIAPHYWAAAMTKPVLMDYFTKLADKSVLPVIL